MLRRLLLTAVLATAALPALFGAPAPKPANQPKLVLTLMVDQLRYDYLVRFRSQFNAGFKRLLEQGAVYTNANLEHYPTVTAIGHSTILSGAKPGVSGIIGNDWFDRQSGKTITSVFDPNVEQTGGGKGSGASPRRMLVSTVGDELKMAGRGSKVIGISLKDRSAILPAGHMADGAFWYDNKSGSFVSSTYYASHVPEWVASFNGLHWADQFAGKPWVPTAGGAPLAKLPAVGSSLPAAITMTPLGNDLVEAMAEAAIEGEKLGQRGVTDLLAVSFSSNDLIGHAKGPDSPEVADVTVQTDRTIGRLFDYVDKKIGMANVLVVLSADHGVAPVPEVNTERKMPGGRMNGDELFDTIDAALDAAFGPEKWILATAGTSPYFDYEAVMRRKADPVKVQEVAAAAAYTVPRVVRVFTRDQLEKGNTPADRFSRRVQESFFPQRSGDLEILIEPYWMRSAGGTTHGSPYSYDAHVPLILMGPGVKPGRYARIVSQNDLAPTLTTLLEVETPSGSAGQILLEAIQ